MASVQGAGGVGEVLRDELGLAERLQEAVAGEDFGPLGLEAGDGRSGGGIEVVGGVMGGGRGHARRITDFVWGVKSFVWVV